MDDDRSAPGAAVPAPRTDTRRTAVAPAVPLARRTSAGSATLVAPPWQRIPEIVERRAPAPAPVVSLVARAVGRRTARWTASRPGPVDDTAAPAAPPAASPPEASPPPSPSARSLAAPVPAEPSPAAPPTAAPPPVTPSPPAPLPAAPPPVEVPAAAVRPGAAEDAPRTAVPVRIPPRVPPRAEPAVYRPTVQRARPPVVQEPSILGLSRLARGRVGSRLFTLFFVAVYALIAVQMVVAILQG
jgi:hypothetical protein